jgi:cytochrome c oxidase assembly factor CtaG
MDVSWWCSGGSGQPWEWRYTPFVGVWLLVGTLAALYVLAHRIEVGGRTHALDRRRTTYLVLGLLTLAVSSEWPLGQLGAGYSATVAMLRVILYSMVAAPLLLSSIPPWLLRHLIRPKPVFVVAKALTRWPVAFLVFNATVVIVNTPLAVDTLKITQLGSFTLDIALLLASLVLWYPVFGQLEELPRLGDPARAAYVLAQSIVPTGPASFLTFSRFPLFRVYELAPPFFAGFDPLSDQQVAGIMMKVVAGFGLIAYAAVLFFNWVRDERDDTTAVSSSEVRRGLDEIERWRGSL